MLAFLTDTLNLCSWKDFGLCIGIMASNRPTLVLEFGKL